MRNRLPSRAASLLLILFAAASVRAQTPAGEFQGQADVGGARRVAPARFDPRGETYTVEGSGANMWGGRDEFHFVWRPVRGDFILTARAAFVGRGKEAHRKLGWQARSTLDADSPHAGAVLRGDRFIMSAARFGEPFAEQSVENVSLGEEVYVGLFVCAHNAGVTERARFRDVRVTFPAPASLVPYRDYIGSRLELLDVGSGARRVVHTVEDSLQAPNWTRDGRALVYNRNGRLYRFDLRTRAAKEIDTGFATSNNNDHVLSFDGRRLGISHHPKEDGGRSVVYVLPSTGGTPRRVTARSPSYLHGWSPDGKFLVYTGERGGEFDIYKIPVEGGEEVRLTDAKGLDDGPEYSPDGRYVYFNSARTGRMQLWRMRPDGTGQEQLTDDGFNNWFPHLSPDGRLVVFLSFGEDVRADEHPFYKRVYVRLMPARGGRGRVLAYVYGGQGAHKLPPRSPHGER